MIVAAIPQPFGGPFPELDLTQYSGYGAINLAIVAIGAGLVALGAPVALKLRHRATPSTSAEFALCTAQGRSVAPGHAHSVTPRAAPRQTATRTASARRRLGARNPRSVVRMSRATSSRSPSSPQLRSRRPPSWSCGLVVATAEGRNVRYDVSDERLGDALRILASLDLPGECD